MRGKHPNTWETLGRVCGQGWPLCPSPHTSRLHLTAAHVAFSKRLPWPQFKTTPHPACSGNHFPLLLSVVALAISRATTECQAHGHRTQTCSLPLGIYNLDMPIPKITLHPQQTLSPPVGVPGGTHWKLPKDVQPLNVQLAWPSAENVTPGAARGC